MEVRSYLFVEEGDADISSSGRKEKIATKERRR